MVGPRELPNAVALNSGLFNGSRVIGPAIAGLVIAAVGDRDLLRPQRRLSFWRCSAHSPSSARRTVPGREGPQRDHRRRPAPGGIVRVERATTPADPLGRHRRIDRGLQLPRPRTRFSRRTRCTSARRLRPAVRDVRSRRASWSARDRRRSDRRAGGSSPSARRRSASRAPARARPEPLSRGRVLFCIGISFTLFTANANALVQLAAPITCAAGSSASTSSRSSGSRRSAVSRRLARRRRRHVAGFRGRGLTSLATIGLANATARARPTPARRARARPRGRV
jgi:hypothetical protein